MHPDKPVPAWKEQARGLVHDAILDAARATFAERGYDGATVDEIAARAEVSKGTIYNYVPGGKAGLFVAVLHAHFDALDALAGRHFTETAGPFRDRYRAFAADVVAYFQSHGDLLRVHLREVPQFLVSVEDGEQAVHLQCQRDRVVDVIAMALTGAIARSEVRDVPAKPTAHVAFGTLIGYLYHASSLHDPGNAECGAGAARFLTDLLFEGLRTDVPSNTGGPPLVRIAEPGGQSSRTPDPQRSRRS